MADADRELLDEVLLGAHVMDGLARDEESFEAVVDAFRAQDGESMHRLLERHEQAERCEVICHWLRSKEAVLLCLELAGPPPLEVEELDLRGFAEVVGQLTADEEMVELMATAVQERDTSAWNELIANNDLQRFNHVLCHWVSTVHYRLVCDVVCQPVRVQRPHLIPELQAAGTALRSLAANAEAFSAAEKAVRANNCETLASILGAGGAGQSCRLICEWFCACQCMLVCLRFCRVFPIDEIESQVDEMREFAQATGRVGTGALERLAAATLSQDVELVEALVRELQFERFCLQFCHWVCFLRCEIFCHCVCPPPEPTPLFTRVGIYRIPTVTPPTSGDFAADGTTIAGRLAFTGGIPLEGIMPNGQSSLAYEYRFLINENAPTASAPAPALGAQVGPTPIGQLEFWAYDNSTNVWYVDTRQVGVNTTFGSYAIPQPGNTTLPPVDLDIPVGTDGWIRVPRMNDYTQGGIGVFQPGGGLAGTDLLMNLETTEFTNENIDLGALLAGDAVLAADLSPRPTYTITFEARVVGAATLTATNTLPTIAFSNTQYAYKLHTEWDGGPVSKLTVCSADILELREGTGCNKLTDTMTALFTCYHPYLASAELFLQGPGIPYPPVAGPYTVSITLPAYGPGAVEAASGVIGPHVFDISGLTPCAYILHLQTTANLTYGNGPIGPLNEDLLAFCIDGGPGLM
ncbi:MAG: hypothetical protein M3083_12750 [Actinomycetota bacterium]|nr:hypothetical protein [Actinomycetota bacterium]MDQ6944995.1 hypothetical protein [Actinomycetota bacterium]